MHAHAHVDALLHKKVVCVLLVGSQRYLYASNSYNALPVTPPALKSGRGPLASSKHVHDPDAKQPEGVQQTTCCSHTYKAC